MHIKISKIYGQICHFTESNYFINIHYNSFYKSSIKSVSLLIRTSKSFVFHEYF